MGIYEKLLKVQTELKAPKNQFNKFGNYYYRNTSDILEAAKPLLLKEGLTLVITDEIAGVLDRVYIKAVVTLTDSETKETIIVSAAAREEEVKKGMDGSQITGAASSYARKYALNGLFCIDDTKDADAPEFAANKLQALAAQKGVNVAEICAAFGKSDVNELTQAEYAATLKRLAAKPNKQ